MKRKWTYLLSLASLVLGACSSMEPDNAAESYGSQLPADFTVSVYSTLNPDVVAAQPMSVIANENARWSDSLVAMGMSKTDIRTRIIADSALFLEQAALVEKIAVSYLNFPWKGIDSLSNQQRAGIVKFNLYEKEGELQLIEAYLANQVDSSAVIASYVKYGVVEGRPYRTCTDAEAASAQERSLMLDGVLNGSVVDYSDYRFCKHMATSKIFVVESR